MAYAEYCGSCGNMVAASVDRPEFANENAEFVADAVRCGNHIERVTCEYTRGNLKRCAPDCECQFCARRRRNRTADFFSDSAPAYGTGGVSDG